MGEEDPRDQIVQFNDSIQGIREFENLTKILNHMIDRLDQAEYNNDAFFLVSMSVVIFLMQCGFGFLEAGSVRSKNTTNILIKNLLDSCISAICYWASGWALAYGKPGNAFCGGGEFLLIGMEQSRYPWWFFQFVFTATASTIVSGALAERCEFVAYFAYCAALTLFVYPVVSHWAWTPEGWLAAHGPGGVAFKDFAGSGVVHVLGGSAAFVGAFILGPRIGRFGSEKHAKAPILGHSVPFTAMGGFLLMFGFFAFNGGSQAQISTHGDGEVVAKAMANTMLSGGFAACTTLGINRFVIGEKWSLLLSINAALTGMVAACAGCDAIEPWAACLLGIGAGLAYLAVAKGVEFIKVDDPLDAVGVHFGGGFWGLFATPWLMHGGIFYTWTGTAFLRLLWNVIGGLVIAVWSAFWLGVVFGSMKMIKMLRVDEEVEIRGLDLFKHGEAAYPLAAYGHGWEEPGMAPANKPGPHDSGGFTEVALKELTDTHPELPLRKRSLYESPEQQAMKLGKNRFNWFQRNAVSDIKTVPEETAESSA